MLYFVQERFLFHPQVLPQEFVYAFPGHVTEVFLPVDGATLSALHFTRTAPNGVVLYLHGNAETLRTADTAAEPFVQRGYDVFLLDYRGYGKSTGRISSEAILLQDAQAAYTYLRQTYHEDQIIVYGRSLGTGLAVHLAATNAPQLLILEAPYLSLQDLIADKAPFIPSFLLKYSLHSDRWIGMVRCPIYLFHGTRDGLIPYSSSQRLGTLITAPHQLTLVQGAGHADIPAFAVYQEQLDRILR
jgi:fermentation-respiration switch protein FrsA (DUF1100 family)